jgi:processive 1,2-diacylglycerol beta-glucosyltransferase
MIELRDAGSGAVLGSLSEPQLRFLVEQLEEESSTDQDYYVDADTVAMLEDAGADQDLLTLLRTALEGRDGLEIRWSRV